MPKARECMTEVLNELKAGRDVMVGRPPMPLFSIKTLSGMSAREARNLMLLADRGVPIGAATDAGTNMMFGFLTHELCHMAKAGLSNAAVLRAATSGAARLLKIDDIGQIKPGFRADVVLYNRDPLADIEAVKKPELVIRDGIPISA
jgi:imidazolonepropionase-like amidohydrolase